MKVFDPIRTLELFRACRKEKQELAFQEMSQDAIKNAWRNADELRYEKILLAFWKKKYITSLVRILSSFNCTENAPIEKSISCFEIGKAANTAAEAFYVL